jgi:hypothetical protein
MFAAKIFGILTAAIVSAAAQAAPDSVYSVYTTGGCQIGAISQGAGAPKIPVAGIDIAVDGIKNVAVLTLDTLKLRTDPGFYRGSGVTPNWNPFAWNTTTGQTYQLGDYIDESGNVIVPPSNTSPAYPLLMYIPLSARDGLTLYRTLLQARASEAYVRLEFAACHYYAKLGYRITGVALLAQ